MVEINPPPIITQPTLTPEEKLKLRLKRLPPRKVILLVVTTGEHGEIVQYAEMAEGKAQS